MTIITKHEIGTTIFFMHNNKVVETIIRGFKIEVTDSAISPDVIYLCGEETPTRVFIKVPENDAYQSKEELLKSL